MLPYRGRLARWPWGAWRWALDHEAEFRRDEDGNIIRDADNVPMADRQRRGNAAVGAGTTGIFGLAFDFLGRAFKNAGGDIAEAVGRGKPRVAGQSAEETRRST